MEKMIDTAFQENDRKELVDALRTALTTMERLHHLVTNNEERTLSITGQSTCLQILKKYEERIL